MYDRINSHFSADVALINCFNLHTALRTEIVLQQIILLVVDHLPATSIM